MHRSLAWEQSTIWEDSIYIHSIDWDFLGYNGHPNCCILHNHFDSLGNPGYTHNHPGKRQGASNTPNLIEKQKR